MWFLFYVSNMSFSKLSDLVDNVTPYEKCVLKKDFAECSGEGVQAEPLMNEKFCRLDDEDSLSVAMRFDFQTAINSKV